jgi:hypothetical protein
VLRAMSCAAAILALLALGFLLFAVRLSIPCLLAWLCDHVVVWACMGSLADGPTRGVSRGHHAQARMCHVRSVNIRVYGMFTGAAACSTRTMRACGLSYLVLAYKKFAGGSRASCIAHNSLAPSSSRPSAVGVCLCSCHLLLSTIHSL